MMRQKAFVYIASVTNILQSRKYANEQHKMTGN